MMSGSPTAKDRTRPSSAPRPLRRNAATAAAREASAGAEAGGSTAARTTAAVPAAASGSTATSAAAAARRAVRRPVRKLERTDFTSNSLRTVNPPCLFVRCMIRATLRVTRSLNAQSRASQRKQDVSNGATHLTPDGVVSAGRTLDRASLPGQVVLVLQGGGNTGSYRGRRLSGADEPAFRAGLDRQYVIGAINASQDRRERAASRLPRLREFWSRCSPTEPVGTCMTWCQISGQMVLLDRS